VIAGDVTFFHSAFSTLRKRPEHRTQLPSYLAIQCFPSIFWDEDNVKLAAHWVWFRLSYSSIWISFREALTGSRKEAFLWTLPDLSNYECLPGEAGGSPAYARFPRVYAAINSRQSVQAKPVNRHAQAVSRSRARKDLGGVDPERARGSVGTGVTAGHPSYSRHSPTIPASTSPSHCPAR
jgi:hypothetical protein